MPKSFRSRIRSVRRFLRGETAPAAPSEPSSIISNPPAFDRLEALARENDDALHPLHRPFVDDVPYDEGRFDESSLMTPFPDNGFVPLWFWHALPGGVLELSTTGFAIHQITDPRRHPYHVRDPDGRWIASGADLQHMKNTAERNASDRAELMMGASMIASEAKNFLRRLGL